MIEVDHILPVFYFPELRAELDNLQTLCRKCNSEKSTKIGYWDFTKKGWSEEKLSNMSFDELKFLGLSNSHISRILTVKINHSEGKKLKNIVRSKNEFETKQENTVNRSSGSTAQKKVSVVAGKLVSIKYYSGPKKSKKEKIFINGCDEKNEINYAGISIINYASSLAKSMIGKTENQFIYDHEGFSAEIVDISEKHYATTKPNTCPKCDFTSTLLEIVYGFDDEMDFLGEEPPDRNVIYGGCCFSIDSPEWRCVRCNNNLYRLREDS